jgi:hypothetical protein
MENAPSIFVFITFPTFVRPVIALRAGVLLYAFPLANRVLRQHCADNSGSQKAGAREFHVIGIYLTGLLIGSPQATFGIALSGAGATPKRGAGRSTDDFRAHSCWKLFDR